MFCIAPFIALVVPAVTEPAWAQTDDRDVPEPVKTPEQREVLRRLLLSRLQEASRLLGEGDPAAKGYYFFASEAVERRYDAVIEMFRQNARLRAAAAKRWPRFAAEQERAARRDGPQGWAPYQRMTLQYDGTGREAKLLRPTVSPGEAPLPGSPEAAAQPPEAVRLRYAHGAWVVDPDLPEERLAEKQIAKETETLQKLAAATAVSVEEIESGRAKEPTSLDAMVRAALVKGELERARAELKTGTRRPATTRPAATAPAVAAAEPTRAAALDAGEVRRMVPGGRVTAIAVHPKGMMGFAAATHSREPLSQWNLETGEKVRTYDVGAETEFHAYCLALSRDGSRIAVAGQGFDPAAVREARTDVKTRRAEGKLVDRDEYFNLTGAEFAVRVFDAETGRLVARLEGHESAVLAVAFSRDGTRLASADADGQVRIWNAADGKAVRTLQATQHHFGSNGVSFLGAAGAGEELLVASLDDNIRVYNVESGAEARTWRIERLAGVLTVAPDGRTVACGRLNAIEFWDAIEAKQRRVIGVEARGGGIFNRANAITFTPEGKRLITAEGVGRLAGSAEPVLLTDSVNVVRVLDLENVRVLAEYAGHVNAPTGAALTPDGKQLLTGSLDGTLSLWRMPK